MVQWLRLLPVRGTWVHPLVRELRWEILSAAAETHCSQTNKLKKSKVETYFDLKQIPPPKKNK